MITGYFWRLPFRPTRAFCRNPVAASLLSEQEDFVAKRLGYYTWLALLREADLPLLFVQKFANEDEMQDGELQEAARLHIVYSGEIATPEEGLQQMRDYWRNFCATLHEKEWIAEGEEDNHIELVELGLAPQWAINTVCYPQAVWKIASNHNIESRPIDKCRPGLPEEDAFVRRLIPYMHAKNRAIVARGLRADATPDDLRALLRLRIRYYARLGLWEAILQHPFVTADIIREMAVRSNAHFFDNYYASSQSSSGELRLAFGMLRHPQTPPETVTLALEFLLQSFFPTIRNSARSYESAPPNAVELSRRAVLHHARHKPVYAFIKHRFFLLPWIRELL